MSKRIKVNNIYEITWPHACAKCGDTGHLENAASIENKLTKKIAKVDPQLEYFVCEKHAKWLALANLSIHTRINIQWKRAGSNPAQEWITAPQR